MVWHLARRQRFFTHRVTADNVNPAPILCHGRDSPSTDWGAPATRDTLIMNLHLSANEPSGNSEDELHARALLPSDAREREGETLLVTVAPTLDTRRCLLWFGLWRSVPVHTLPSVSCTEVYMIGDIRRTFFFGVSILQSLRRFVSFTSFYTSESFYHPNLLSVFFFSN